MVKGEVAHSALETITEMTVSLNREGLDEEDQDCILRWKMMSRMSDFTRELFLKTVISNYSILFKFMIYSPAYLPSSIQLIRVYYPGLVRRTAHS